MEGYIVTAIARPPFRQSRLAIAHLTQFAFAKDRQKQNQLNLPLHHNMVWHDGATNMRVSLRSVNAQATGVWYFLLILIYG